MTTGSEKPSPEQDFWLVLPMHVRSEHPVVNSDQVLVDRYLDADGVVRRTIGADGDETEVVTHWAVLAGPPGLGVLELTGASGAAELAAAQQQGRARPGV